MNATHHFTPGVLTFTALLLPTVGAQALELRGFRGIAWGSDVTQLGPTERVSTEGDVSCHTRSDENLLFGNIALKSVHYCFNRGQFFMVKIDSTASSKALRDEFQRTYGPPTEMTPQTVVWGQRVSGSRAEVSAIGKDMSTLKLYFNALDVATGDVLMPSPPAAGPTATKAR